MYASIQAASQLIEVERACERFSNARLPSQIKGFCQKAPTCLPPSAFNAGAAMHRRAAQSSLRDLGEGGKLRRRHQFEAARNFA